MSFLEVRNLTKRFPDGTVALKDISFSVSEGDFLIISGKNGSGKSVLMRHLNGLYRPDNGEVFFKNVSIFKDILTVRQKLGVVFQNSDNQIVSQTVGQDVSFGPENLNFSDSKQKNLVTNALQDVHLIEKINHNTRTLSGGEKRRLSIAGVLAMDPEVIILDEPFTNLDFPGVKQILQQILKLHSSGHTIICITHELDKILYHADRLIILDQGRIVCNDIPELSLYKAHKYDIRIPGDIGKESPKKILERMSWLK